MKAVIDKNSCILCGMCGGACPDVFRVDNEGKSMSVDIELIGDILQMARHAESICPTWAIQIQASNNSNLNTLN